MKRDINLQTLSWEHHDGLVLALRLKKGVLKNASIEVMAARLSEAWQEDLQPHFAHEEHTLLPVLTVRADCDELLKRFRDDHRELSQRAETIATGTVSHSDLQFFAGRLEAHIRFEERELFPFIESVCSTTQLAEIGLYLKNNHNKVCRTYQNEFWK